MGNCFISSVTTAQGTAESLSDLISSGHIEKRFTQTYDTAVHIPVKQDLKVIVLSDVHRGNGDEKTDLGLKSKQTYMNALDYYYKNGYLLVLNGDIEDTWLHDIKDIIKANGDAYALEKKFNDEGRLIKIAGNHDDIWYDSNNNIDTNMVNKYLTPVFGNVKVYDSVRLVLGKDEFFIMHCHQGSYDNSSCCTSVSKCCIGTCFEGLLTCCNVDKKSYVSPSTNTKIASALDLIISKWTKDNKKNTIGSHTHHTVLHNTDAKNCKLKSAINAGSSYYYNTGCCCVDDGSLTGVEIRDGAVHLITFSKDATQPTVIESNIYLKT